MIQRLIEWSLKNRFLVLTFYLLVAGWGIWAVYRTPIDAIPDLSENQVIVFAEWPGRSPQELEDQVTYPLVVNLQGLAGVKSVRAYSNFGFSMITVIFEDRIDNYFARTRVLERLNQIGGQMPKGVVPVLGPDATSLGWIYQYYFDTSEASKMGKGYDLGELRAIQDWFVRYQLNSVPGVAEVASVGGFVRQYQIDVDPNKMRAYGVNLKQIMDAVVGSNNNVGGNVIEQNDMEFIVRGLGLIENVGDVEKILVGYKNQQPILIRDIAIVRLGPDFRRGTLDRNGNEVVGGIVIMRYGESTSEVIRRVKAKLKQIQPGLPPGVEIRAFYDRSELIDRAVATLRNALIEEVILVTIAHIVFLFHFRSIAIVTIPLPLSILMSFIFMKHFGITSNIMSLAGIAIAIGVLVDAGIVVTEAVMREAFVRLKRDKGNASEAEKRKFVAENMNSITLAATRLVVRPIFFSMLIIILAFIPVFFMTGREGKLFHPLAFTKTFAMVASTALAVTLVPVLCTLLVRGRIHDESENVVMKFLMGLYVPALKWALGHRVATVGIAALVSVGALMIALFGIGREFMPPLNERALLFMPTTVPSASLTEVKRVMAEQDRILSAIPEVESVVGKLGRAETATDPAPISMIETTITLKPESEWRSGMTMAELRKQIQSEMSVFPGFPPSVLQPIENRILMLSTGVRGQVAVILLGSDLKVLEEKAVEVENVLKSIQGATGVYALRVGNTPYLNIELNRSELARYGISMEDVLEIIESAIGGKNLTVTIEGRQRFPVRVRYARELRDSPQSFGDILVYTMDGMPIPLSKVATIRTVMGPSEIQSENGQIRVWVQCSVEGRDLGGFVEEAKKIVGEQVKLPAGYFITWGGEYENLLRASRTLWQVVPVVIFIIFILLYIVYRSFKDAANVLLAVPFSLTGGLILQWILGYNFSVAVWVGYIALFGTAVQTGVVMVIYLDEAVRRHRELHGGILTSRQLIDAIIEGSALRLRPKVMTVSTVLASLIPIMLPLFSGERTGIEVMRPIATPVVGGMISSLIMVLLVTPVIFYWLRRREVAANKKPPSN